MLLRVRGGAMAKYRYSAINAVGKYERGSLDASSYDRALTQLDEQGLWTVRLTEQRPIIRLKDVQLTKPTVKSLSFTMFCRQLATMYQSGVKVVTALEILAKQTDSRTLSKVLKEMAAVMRTGSQFSEAATKYPSIFNTVFINMIRAGEESGRLDEVLHRLAVYYEKEHHTKEKIKSALMYPVIMSIFMIIAIAFMMMFIIPRYVANFQLMGVELPLATQMVIQLSDFMLQNGYLVFAVIIIPILMLFGWRRTEQGRYLLDLWKLKFPIFGRLWHQQAIARFSHTFSSLYSAGLPMLHIVSILSKVVGNEAIGRQIIQARQALEEGESLTKPFRESALFSPMVVQMMEIGEQSGQLDAMMGKIAEFYEADVDALSDRLKSMLEPLLILALSVIVGGIVIAVLLPVFQMLETI